MLRFALAAFLLAASVSAEGYADPKDPHSKDPNPKDPYPKDPHGFDPHAQGYPERQPHGFDPYPPHGYPPHRPHRGFPKRSSGATLQSLSADLASLNNRLKNVIEEASDVKILASVADADINFIYNFAIPKIELYNKQQDELIESYGAQIKDAQHGLDAAMGLEKTSLTLAGSTNEETERQLNDVINGELKQEAESTNKKIKDTRMDVTDLKKAFFDALETTITDLNTQEDGNRKNIDVLNKFVDRRTCEFGYVVLDPHVETFVAFKTQKDTKCQVTLALTGFKAHADVKKYKGGYDKLEYQHLLGDVSLDGFTVKAVDKSQGMVELSETAISYMACQYLDENVEFKY